MVKKLVMIGTFPPPVHGMAAANQAVYERLVAEGWSIIKIDTAPRTLSRSILARLGRISKMLRAWFFLIRFFLKKKNRKTVTYLTLSGGWGQVYDLITVFLCKVMGAHTVMHHHSFAYLDKYRKLSSFIFRIAGIDADHVVLCKNMREVLKKCYQVQNVIVLSNVVLFPMDKQSKHKEDLRTIGFLSNITYEKGGGIIIKLAHAVEKRKMPLKVIVAGPCHDEKLTSELKLAGNANILQWRGAVYGVDKTRFWEDIDAFIFPTLNEAEPLVLWEALSAGIPIIAYSRGCIEEQISDAAGISVQVNNDFINDTLLILDSWLQNPDIYKATVISTRKYYSEIENQRVSSWKNFERLLLNS